MKRSILTYLSMLAVGCAVGTSDEGATFGGGGPGPVTKGDQPEGTSDGTDGDSTTTDADGSSDGSFDTSDDGSNGVDTSGVTTLDTSTSTTSDPDADAGNDDDSDPTDDPPGGGQPDDGMYSACITADHCPGLAGCATIGDPPTDGFCTDLCAGPNNPAGCDPSPEGTATVTCMVLSGFDLCALDCSGGKTCPAPMVCTSVMDEQGLKDICY